MPPTLSVAVFAHAEAPGLTAALASLAAAATASGLDCTVTILANGCREAALASAREFAARHARWQVAEIPVADKANAWNTYVHALSAGAPGTGLHVFLDGDVTINPTALTALAAAHAAQPAASAIGALPLSGRSRHQWIADMQRSGTLAGGLYALPEAFLARLRQRGIRLPRGLIGEDLALSLLAKCDLQPLARASLSAAPVVFAPGAGFAFPSLSPWRPADYRLYWQRLRRYALRGVQFEMLFAWLVHQPPETLPATVAELYRRGALPSRLKWVGPISCLRFLAVQQIRRDRATADAPDR